MPWLSRSALGAWFARFAIVFLVLAFPWPGLGAVWTRVSTTIGNQLLFAHLTFGRGGHAHLRPANEAERGQGGNIVADSIVELRVDGWHGDVKFGMSQRRDGYLPIALTLATIAAAPLPGRRKLRAALVGGVTMLLLTLACQLGLIYWLFANQLKDVLAWGPAARSTVDIGFATFLLPPANRHVVPLLLGLGLSWWQHRASERAAAETPRPIAVPPAVVPAGARTD